jgi:tetratricopeptide (TPR) repeat protein
MTIARNHVWNDSLTLWQDTAQKSPNKGIVQANLAAEYLSRNMPDKSLPLFVRAIELNPNLDFRAKTGVGASLQALRLYGSRFTTGEEYVLPGGTLNGGVLDYGNISKWESVINNAIGLSYEYLKEPDKARRSYEASLTMNPKYDLAWYNLAILSSRQGNKQHAAEAVERLKTINPPMARILESTILLH